MPQIARIRENFKENMIFYGEKTAAGKFLHAGLGRYWVSVRFWTGQTSEAEGSLADMLPGQTIPHSKVGQGGCLVFTEIEYSVEM